jgi:class 3 adenylate cyclase/pimeloyl-ACP methyl ester carboxylesterase
MLDRTVRYVRSGEGQVAYSVFGSGPLELLLIDDWAWHLEAVWDYPDSAAEYERIASYARVVMWNRRGVGLSDPLPLDQMTTIDSGLNDVLAVLDATGLERCAVIGAAGGVALAVVLAATHPERVSALVLSTDTSRLAWGQDRENADALFDWYIKEIESGWGTGVTAQSSPTLAADPRYVAWMARMERLTCSPARAVAMWRATYATDLSQVLPSVRVPTLVVHSLNYFGRDTHLAELIPGARYVEVPGDLALAGTDDGRAGDEIEAFLTGVRHARPPQRVLATLVFTDIVDSTARAARVGDAAWLSLLERHDTLSRQHADRFGGRIVKSTGDGLLATFDGPARAVGFALAMRDGVKALALTIRAGVHTGEVELQDQDIGGLGVHIAARISGVAEPDEVLASRTVKDLTAGARIAFVDRGAHALKGLPEDWPLFSVSTV